MKKYEVFAVSAVLTLTALIIGFCFIRFYRPPKYIKNDVKIIHREGTEPQKSVIKWAEFTPDCQNLIKAAEYDINSEGKIPMTVLLAYSSAKSGGRPQQAFINECASLIENGGYPKETKAFNYYKEVYDLVLGGFTGKKGKNYGILVTSPIPKGFYFTHSRDFGETRNYGFSRTHKGNDLMGNTGTPICAVEGGVVEELGWNRYGGWRMGIRSNDKKRYWYYAHLRKDFPYKTGLKKGDSVFAGEVIGYMGMTGYSDKENVNNVNIPHLHLGLQIIPDGGKKESDNEIWVDIYEIVEFTEQNKSEVTKIENNNEEYIEK